jgi:hypothetical protein
MGMASLKDTLFHLQTEIADMLGMDTEHLRFEYEGNEQEGILKLVTINPRHKQSFLFHELQGFGELDATHKMVDYVRSHRQSKNSYTIQWALREDSELHTSYFRGKHVYEVLDKFYYGKDITTTIIFSISLNPIA